MKKQRLKKLRREEGFFSAFILVFLVTLALMGVGASILVQSESKNIIHHINSVKSDYVIEGAAFYCASALTAGTLTNDTTFTFANIDVVVDTLYEDDTLIMNVKAIIDDDSTRKIRFEMKENSLWRYAIYVGENVTMTTTRDSNNVTDTDLIVENKDPLPSVDDPTLTSLSSSQGHDRGGPFTPAEDFPSPSFYQADGVTPNVTHVFGNMTVNANITIWGIFVVEGSVFLERRADVRGIIYLGSAGTSVTGMSANTDRDIPNVLGGIFGKGQVTIESGSRRLYVQHQPEWMRVFAQYVADISGMKIAHWSY